MVDLNSTGEKGNSIRTARHATFKYLADGLRQFLAAAIFYKVTPGTGLCRLLDTLSVRSHREENDPGIRPARQQCSRRLQPIYPRHFNIH